MLGKRREVREVETTAPVVGFFMHRDQVSACGEPGFWCTSAPQSPTRVASEADLIMNGYQLTFDAMRPADADRWVSCCRCGHWMKLTINRYRAIPRTSSEVVKLNGQRAIRVSE